MSDPGPRPPFPERLRGFGARAADNVRAGADLAVDMWFGLSRQAKRGLALGLILFVALAVAAFLLTRPGPPRDDAIELVPGDAYAYLHVNTDSGSDQFKAAGTLLERFPKQGAVRSRLGALGVTLGDQQLELARDVRPWLGDEAALALVQAGARGVGVLAIFEVGDESGAKAFLGRTGGPGRRPYKGVPLRAYGRDLAAFVGDFLVIGQQSAVKRAIDFERGRRGSLAQDRVASEVRGELPENRIADAYISQEGGRRLFGDQEGGVGEFVDTFVNLDATRGAAGAVVADEQDTELFVTSALDPEREKVNPGFFGAFVPFEPTLASEIGADALGYLGLASPERTLDRLIDLATIAEPGLARSFEQFQKDLKKEGRVDIQRELLPLLKGEATIAAEPNRPVPILTMVVKDVDERKARVALAKLQAPIARSLDPARAGRAPTFDQRDISGVRAISIRLSPTVNLTYAVFDGMLVMSTDPKGVQRLRAEPESLEGSEVFKRTLSDRPDRVSALLFLDLEGLIGLGERAGLGEDPAYAQVRDDLQRLRALGLTVTAEDDNLTSRVSVDTR